MTRRRRQPPFLEDMGLSRRDLDQAIGIGTFGPEGWAPLPERTPTKPANDARHAKSVEQRDRARVMRGRGHTNEEIAEALDVNVRTVQRYINASRG